MPTRKPAVNLQETFDEIAAMLEHHRALMALAHRQDATQRGVAAQLQQRQNEVELRRRASGLHPADLAVVLEGLSAEDRLPIWNALDPPQAAEVLVELDAPARAWLVDQTDRYRL